MEVGGAVQHRQGPSPEADPPLALLRVVAVGEYLRRGQQARRPIDPAAYRTMLEEHGRTARRRRREGADHVAVGTARMHQINAFTSDDGRTLPRGAPDLPWIPQPQGCVQGKGRDTLLLYHIDERAVVEKQHGGAVARRVVATDNQQG